MSSRGFVAPLTYDWKHGSWAGPSGENPMKLEDDGKEFTRNRSPHYRFDENRGGVGDKSQYQYGEGMDVENLQYEDDYEYGEVELDRSRYHGGAENRRTQAHLGRGDRQNLSPGRGGGRGGVPPAQTRGRRGGRGGQKFQTQGGRGGQQARGGRDQDGRGGERRWQTDRGEAGRGWERRWQTDRGEAGRGWERDQLGRGEETKPRGGESGPPLPSHMIPAPGDLTGREGPARSQEAPPPFPGGRPGSRERRPLLDQDSRAWQHVEGEDPWVHHEGPLMPQEPHRDPQYPAFGSRGRGQGSFPAGQQTGRGVKRGHGDTGPRAELESAKRARVGSDSQGEPHEQVGRRDYARDQSESSVMNRGRDNEQRGRTDKWSSGWDSKSDDRGIMYSEREEQRRSKNPEGHWLEQRDVQRTTEDRRVMGNASSQRGQKGIMDPHAREDSSFSGDQTTGREAFGEMAFQQRGQQRRHSGQNVSQQRDQQRASRQDEEHTSWRDQQRRDWPSGGDHRRCGQRAERPAAEGGRPRHPAHQSQGLEQLLPLLERHREADEMSDMSLCSDEGQDPLFQMTEEEFNEGMYHRLREVLNSGIDSQEREACITRHIREMAKLSPTLFRRFMASNAQHLAAMAKMQSESTHYGNEEQHAPGWEPQHDHPPGCVLPRQPRSPPAPEAPERVQQLDRVIDALRAGNVRYDDRPLQETDCSSNPREVLQKVSDLLGVDDRHGQELRIRTEERQQERRVGEPLPEQDSCPREPLDQSLSVRNRPPYFEEDPHRRTKPGEERALLRTPQCYPQSEKIIDHALSRHRPPFDVDPASDGDGFDEFPPFRRPLPFDPAFDLHPYWADPPFYDHFPYKDYPRLRGRDEFGDHPPGGFHSGFRDHPQPRNPRLPVLDREVGSVERTPKLNVMVETAVQRNPDLSRLPSGFSSHGREGKRHKQEEQQASVKEEHSKFTQEAETGRPQSAQRLARPTPRDQHQCREVQRPESLSSRDSQKRSRSQEKSQEKHRKDSNSDKSESKSSTRRSRSPSRQKSMSPSRQRSRSSSRQKSRSPVSSEPARKRSRKSSVDAAEKEKSSSDRASAERQREQSSAEEKTACREEELTPKEKPGSGNSAPTDGQRQPSREPEKLPGVGDDLMSRARKLLELQQELDQLAREKEEWLKEQEVGMGVGDPPPPLTPAMIVNTQRQLDISLEMKALKEGKTVDSLLEGETASFLKASSEEKKKTAAAPGRGLNCCKRCDLVFRDPRNFVSHLSSYGHLRNQRPASHLWQKEEMKKYQKKDNCPIKGAELLVATVALYCPLCCQLCPDSRLAEAHLRSQQHHHRYQAYVSKHPSYERHYQQECWARWNQAARRIPTSLSTGARDRPQPSSSGNTSRRSTDRGDFQWRSLSSEDVIDLTDMSPTHSDDEESKVHPQPASSAGRVLQSSEDIARTSVGVSSKSQPEAGWSRDAPQSLDSLSQPVSTSRTASYRDHTPATVAAKNSGMEVVFESMDVSVETVLVSAITTTAAATSTSMPTEASGEEPVLEGIGASEHTAKPAVTKQAATSAAVKQTPGQVGAALKGTSSPGKSALTASASKITSQTATSKITSQTAASEITSQTAVSKITSQTAVSKITSQTAVSTVSTVTRPASAAAKSSPASTASEATPASAAVKPMPASATSPSASGNTAGKLTPPKAAVKPTPASVTAEQTPTSASAKQTPASASAKQTPASASAKQTPASASAKQIPASASAKQTPASASAKQTPARESAKQTPASAAAQSASGSTAAKLTPVKAAAKPTPASAASKQTSAAGKPSPTSTTTTAVLKSTPASGTAERTSTAAKPTPTSASAKSMPITTTAVLKPTPTSATAKQTPASAGAKPTSATAKPTPASSVAKQTPASAGAKPTSATAKPTPASSVAKQTPASAGAKPTSATAKPTPASSVAKQTPASAGAKPTSATAKPTPASSVAKQTPVTAKQTPAKSTGASASAAVKPTPTGATSKPTPASASAEPASTNTLSQSTAASQKTSPASKTASPARPKPAVSSTAARATLTRAGARQTSTAAASKQFTTSKQAAGPKLQPKRAASEETSSTCCAAQSEAPQASQSAGLEPETASVPTTEPPPAAVTASPGKCRTRSSARQQKQKEKAESSGKGGSTGSV